MNREQRRSQLKAVKGNSNGKKPRDPEEFVKRQEVFDIVAQMGDNMDAIQQNMVEATNTLYGSHVFPAQMEIAALEKLLIDKGVITQEEIDNKVKEHKQEILDRAKQIKENQDGELEPVPEDEAVLNERKAVVKASISGKE